MHFKFILSSCCFIYKDTKYVQNIGENELRFAFLLDFSEDTD